MMTRRENNENTFEVYIFIDGSGNIILRLYRVGYDDAIIIIKKILLEGSS